MTHQTRPLWAIAGLISLGLGILGVALPVLPTTPFVLLAAFCFGKGAPRLRAWLDGTATFGPAIADWEMRGAIPTKAKVLACSLMAVTFGGSLWAGLPMGLLLIQAICMGGAALYVLSRPS